MSFSIRDDNPSASPLSKSNATIIKSLSGGSKVDGEVDWLQITHIPSRHGDLFITHACMLTNLLIQRLLNQAQASLENRLGIRKEARLEGGGDGAEALWNNKLVEKSTSHIPSNLQQRKQILVVIFQRIPLGNHDGHEHVLEILSVEMLPNRVRQRPDRIVKNEQILVLILAKGENQRLQNVLQIRDQLCAGLLRQRGERTTGGLLDSLVRIRDSLQQPREQRLNVQLVILMGGADPVGVTRQGPARDRADQ